MTNEEIALKWFEAFNQHHLENLLSLYHENSQHYIPKLKVKHPETNGLIIGKNALRTWWDDAFLRLPNLYYSITNLTANNKRIFMEYIRQVPNEEDLLVAEVLEIENEKIIASKVYHG
jgi:hypothetical protein